MSVTVLDTGGAVTVLADAASATVLDTAGGAAVVEVASGLPGVGAVRYATLAAALADGAKLVAGQRVFVAAADRRGGEFTVESDGAATDGVTCYALDADTSAEQTVTFAKSLISDNPAIGYDLPHQSVIFGSVKVYYDTTRPSLYFTDLELSGHVLNPVVAGGVYAFFDHALGRLKDRWSYLKGAIVQSNVTVKYKYATSARRLKRVLARPEVNLDWSGAAGFAWGGTPGADASNELCWALNTAKRLGLSRVHLPRVYTFARTVELPSGVALAGDGPGVSGLRVADGEAVRIHRLDYDTTTPRYKLVAGWPVLIGESGATDLRVEELTIDGNLDANLEWLTSPVLYNGSLAENELQNTPSNNCLATTNHGGRVVPAGQTLRLHNVTLRNALGSNVLTHANTRLIAGGELAVGKCLRNHGMYCYGEVEADTVTASGHAWGTHFVLQRGCIKRLVFAGGAVNPHFPNLTALVNVRHPDGTGDPVTQLNILSASLDLTGLDCGSAFAGVGDSLRLGDLWVKPPANKDPFYLFRVSHNGLVTRRFEGLTVADATVVEQGDSLTTVLGSSQWFGAEVRNVAVVPPDETTVVASSATLGELYANALDATWTGPQKVFLRNVRVRGKRWYLFKTDTPAAPTTPVPLEVLVEACEFNNSDNNTPLVSLTNSGRVDALRQPSHAGKIRWHWRDTNLNIYATNTARLELFLRLGREFTNVRALNLTAASALQVGNTGMDDETRRSEAAGTLAFTAAGGETSKLLALPLWWDPAYHRVWPGNATTAARGVAWAERTDSAGTAWPAWVSGTDSNRTQPWLKVYFTNALQMNDSIVLHYEARVRGPNDPSPIG
jgi:hypothetical protein